MTAALPRSVRLRTLNSLMATMVGTAPQLRRDVDAVLRVFENDDDTDPGLGPQGLAAAAAQMLQLLAPQQPVPAIAVLDHRDLPFDALWAPERIADALATTGKPSMSCSGWSACRISTLPAPALVRPNGVKPTTRPSKGSTPWPRARLAAAA